MIKSGSVTSKIKLPKKPLLQKTNLCHVGDVIIAEVIRTNPNYPYLERPNGKLTKLKIGDKIVGAIGARQALRGFVGCAPEKIDDQTTLSLLNIGGVIGCYKDSAVGLGEPPKLKYLGTVIDKKGILNINRSRLPDVKSLSRQRPIVLILGTCMNVGKTSSAIHLIQAATQSGYRVGAAKITGVAAIKDLEAFMQAGAVDVKSFLDCGLPSTVDVKDLSQVVKNIIEALDGDLLMIELGDGILGHYNVESVLTNKEIMSQVTSVVVCAADLTAAFGAKHYLDEKGIRIDLFSGPTTDNVAGSSYIEKQWHIPVMNSFKPSQTVLSTYQHLWSKA